MDLRLSDAARLSAAGASVSGRNLLPAGKTVSLMTVFVWVRFLAVLLLRLSFYAAARLFELPVPAALAAAVMAPLISSVRSLRPGIRQLCMGRQRSVSAVDCGPSLLLSLGFGFRATRRGGGAARRRGAARPHVFGTSDIRIHGRDQPVSCWRSCPGANASSRKLRLVRTVRIGRIASRYRVPVLPLFSMAVLSTTAAGSRSGNGIVTAPRPLSNCCSPESSWTMAPSGDLSGGTGRIRTAMLSDDANHSPIASAWGRGVVDPAPLREAVLGTAR